MNLFVFDFFQVFLIFFFGGAIFGYLLFGMKRDGEKEWLFKYGKYGENEEFKTWFRFFSIMEKVFIFLVKSNEWLYVWLNVWFIKKCIVIEIMIFKNKVKVFSLVQV